jgi:RecJ-like exonuclease
MTGFLMIIYAAAALVAAVEIGRLVHAQERAGRCDSCAGTGRLPGSARCLPCAGTGRAARVLAANDRREVTQPSEW